MIEELIEKSKNGLLAPSEVVLLGKVLNMTVCFLVDEENRPVQVAREDVIQWIENALQ